MMTRTSATGIAYAAAAYLSWGVFPLYFRALDAVRPAEILAHRIVWSAVFLVLLISALGRWREVLDCLRAPRALAGLSASALFISANWLVYIWAVHSGHVLE